MAGGRVPPFWAAETLSPYPLSPLSGGRQTYPPIPLWDPPPILNTIKIGANPALKHPLKGILEEIQ